MIKHLRALRKFLLFVTYVLIFLTLTSLIRLVVWDLTTRRRLYTPVVHWITWMGCILLHAKVNVINKPEKHQHYLYVGNHLGFFDIMVLASTIKTLFVTSQEMRETPFLGTLCEMGGCLFVERRDRTKVAGEMLEIRESLRRGFSVTLYPEGTSGDASRVLPFKKGLMMAAAGTGVPIKVMTINYRRINGEPVSHQTRKYFAWYGDMSFFGSLWDLFTLRSMEIDLAFHDEIVVHNEEERRQVADRAQKIVEAHFTPIPFPEGEFGLPLVANPNVSGVKTQVKIES